MDTAPLLQWLGLPPGPWPPDDRALLGLPAGAVSAAEAEQLALGRMERLRPHQLKHPELVTEGMNRLAQALIAVTSAAVGSVPSVPIPPPKPRKVAKRPKPKPEPPPAPMPAVDFTPVAPPPPKPPVVLEAEVVLDAEPVVLKPEASAERKRPAPRPPQAHAPLTIPEPPEGTNYFPKSRRKGYRELAFLRKLRTQWELLRSSVGDANQPLTSAEAVFELLTGAREIATLRNREEFRHVIRGDALSVAAVVAQPAVLTVLRELVPSQRWGLAVSWDAGRVALERREKWLRERMRTTKPPRGNGATAREFCAFFRENPEWLLVALTAACLAVGVVRAVGRNAG